MEQTFAVNIDDDVNGGWPEVQGGDAFGFSMITKIGANEGPRTFRYRSTDASCEQGTSVELMPYPGAVHMASYEKYVYYGLFELVGKTVASNQLNVSLDGSWGTFNATLTLEGKNELIITGQVFDDTRYENGVAQCPSIQDDNVPFHANTGNFASLAVTGLGLFGADDIYSTGGPAPVEFGLTMRGPFWNPYLCTLYTASQGYGPHDNADPNGVSTLVDWSSPDNGTVLGQRLGILKSLSSSGSFNVVFTGGDIRGRPWRWNGPASKRNAGASKADPGAQVLVLRADALVNVLLTDGLGQQIGFDAAGNPINDFGASGQTITGPGGWPKLIALRDPELGLSGVDVHAISAGDWSVQAYLSHESAGGYSTTTLGSAVGPEDVVRGLYLGNPLGASWHQGLTSAELPETSRVSFVAGPVPAKGDVRFRFRAPDAGARVELAIFDLRGRRVAIPLAPTERAGLTVVDWEGRSSNGHRLARGVYMARLVVDGQQYIQRIVLAH